MAEKKLLLGDEAIALGAIHAGISGVYAYPGTPSTEITEFIQNNPLAKERKLHSTWCTNEKTAMEAALGMSYAGKRALVCMKHVGMNVAADAFVNSAITGVNGGLVVLAADDPSMHSSQNEQDSRFYGKFAMIPMLEPSKQINIKTMRYPYSLTHSLNISGNIKMGSRWNVTYSSGYDFTSKEMSMTTVNITRDLHCFNMSCGLVFGPYTSYNFSIRANSAMLTDALKWDQRSNTGSQVTWY